VSLGCGLVRAVDLLGSEAGERVLLVARLAGVVSWDRVWIVVVGELDAQSSSSSVSVSVVSSSMPVAPLPIPMNPFSKERISDKVV
jgi:hypothetical protein